MSALRSAALTVRFLLELAALAGLFVVGVSIVDGFPGYVVGAAFVAAAAAAWGLVVAPKARLALPTPARLAVEAAVFAAAAVGLIATDRAVAGLVLAGAYVLDRLALLASGAPAFEPPR
jgi:hypothetical protein